MKKIIARIRRLSRLQLILGVAVLVVLVGGATWSLYDNQQKSNAKKEELAKVNQLIDQQLASQTLNGIQSEITNDAPQQSTPTPEAGQTSPSPTSPSAAAPRQSTPSSGTSIAPSQSTQSSLTSPVYPNDNGDTPQVTLTNPGYWKQIVSGSFTATATASDSSGINRVVFMLRKIGQAAPVQTVTDTEAPYSAVITVSGLPNGENDYTVEAQAFDNTAKGNLASYRITIQN